MWIIICICLFIYLVCGHISARLIVNLDEEGMELWDYIPIVLLWPLGVSIIFDRYKRLGKIWRPTVLKYKKKSGDSDQTPYWR